LILMTINPPPGLTISSDVVLRSAAERALLKSLRISILLVPGPLRFRSISLMKILSTRLKVCVVSMSLAVLLARLVSETPAGGLTETVLVTEPVVPGAIVPLSVMVALAPEARLTVHTSVVELKVPELGVPKLAPVSAVGIVSLRLTLLTALGPLLVTVIV